MRMNAKDILRMDPESLNKIVDMLASDLAYLNHHDNITRVGITEFIGEFEPWEDLSIYDVQELLEQYPPEHEVVTIKLTDDQWRKLFRLLAEDVLFMNHYDPDADNHQGLSVAIITNDLFHYAADAEGISFNDIDVIYDLWEQGGLNRIIQYVAEKRGYPPLQRTLDRLTLEEFDVSVFNHLKRA